jgi:hypothetical protein
MNSNQSNSNDGTDEVAENQTLSNRLNLSPSTVERAEPRRFSICRRSRWLLSASGGSPAAGGGGEPRDRCALYIALSICLVLGRVGFHLPTAVVSAGSFVSSLSPAKGWALSPFGDEMKMFSYSLHGEPSDGAGFDDIFSARHVRSSAVLVVVEASFASPSPCSGDAFTPSWGSFAVVVPELLSSFKDGDVGSCFLCQCRSSSGRWSFNVSVTSWRAHGVGSCGDFQSLELFFGLAGGFHSGFIVHRFFGLVRICDGRWKLRCCLCILLSF